MRKSVIIAFLATITACSGLPKAKQARLNAIETITVKPIGRKLSIDTAITTIRFTGHGIGQNHSGIFKLSKGKIWIENQTVTGGEFIINILSLQLEKKEALIQRQLRPHLLSADFFNATAYPTATFSITKAEILNPANTAGGFNYVISGNLALKEISKNISFPAKLQITDSTLTGVANFNIDRTWWHINYGNDKSLGDRFISKMVNIQLYIQAKQ